MILGNTERFNHKGHKEGKGQLRPFVPFVYVVVKNLVPALAGMSGLSEDRG